MASSYATEPPPVGRERTLQEVMATRDAFDEWYGNGSMTSCSLVAYIEKKVGHISPGAAADYGVSANWPELRERVIALLEAGDNAALVLFNELRAKQGLPTAKAS